MAVHARSVGTLRHSMGAFVAPSRRAARCASRIHTSPLRADRSSGREKGGTRTDLGQSGCNPRATALADLYHDAAALADAGDIAGARTLHEAIGRLLGDERAIRADVIDLNEKRRPRPREPRLV